MGFVLRDLAYAPPILEARREEVEDDKDDSEKGERFPEEGDAPADDDSLILIATGGVGEADGEGDGDDPEEGIDFHGERLGGRGAKLVRGSEPDF